MPLPPDFQFSQGSLQDYVDCPRRFQLRYLLRLAWPAPVAEPMREYERHMQDGEAFHRLVHQHILGLPPARLGLAIRSEQEDLSRWWQNYLACAPASLSGDRYPELAVSAPVGAHRLMARYDLVAIDLLQGATIFDWKTALVRPHRSGLALRLQTRVYRYLLVRAAADLTSGHVLAPEQVSMVYWFADFPGEPERFDYDGVQYAADVLYLTRLIEQIDRCGDADLPCADDDRPCGFCSYRSLCNRGVRAGDAAAMDDDLAEVAGSATGFDFEQIAEIAF
jgi:hypothetical protein